MSAYRTRPPGALDLAPPAPDAAWYEQFACTATCRRCLGIFDVTYDNHTRAGRCPACHSMWQGRVLVRLVNRGMEQLRAFRLSRHAARRWDP